MENKKDKNDVFFGENGITCTSAENICDNAKEYYETILNDIDSARFRHADIQVVGEEKVNRTEIGWDSERLQSVLEKIPVIIEMKDLIGYYREAIKAHDAKVSALNRMTIDEFAEKFGIEMPVRPTQEPTITENDVLAEMSIKERHEMLRLQAIVSTYGKYIHPRGAFSIARADLSNKINNPVKKEGSGRDTIITTYTPSVQLKEVDDLLFSMRVTHREAQSRLNGYKHKIDTAVRADQIEKTAKYAAEYDEYTELRSALYAKFEAWKKEELARIEKLKIVTPNNLIETYKKVNAFGKKKEGKSVEGE